MRPRGRKFRLRRGGLSFFRTFLPQFGAGRALKIRIERAMPGEGSRDMR